MKIAVAISCATLLFATRSHGDPERRPRPSLPSQTEQAAAASQNGEATPPRTPFSPYEIGPAGTHALSYDQLSKDEKAQAERGREAQLPPSTVEAYGAAVKAASHRATREAAAHKLGLEHLELIGVVL